MTGNGQYNLPVFTPLETDGHNCRLSGNHLARWNILFLTGFTLVELFIVLIVLIILAAIAVPLYTSAGSVQVKTAANMIASDLEYAKSMAMSTGRNYSVVFDDSGENYKINDANGQVIPHPVHIGASEGYTISFVDDGRLDKVDIVNTTFAANTVEFDYLGAPCEGGLIQLQAEGYTLTVKVEPVTGYVSIE